MGNLLGDVWLTQEQNGGDADANQSSAASGRKDLNLSCLSQHPNVIDLVLYGKREARAGRKMGHFVTYAEDAQTALSTAAAFREQLMNSPAN
jgi:phosphoribosylaminoimidazole carboxylase (NCAIR synthetase)